MFQNIIAKLLHRNIYHDIIESLVAALEAKDCYTCGHSERVAALTCELAGKLGIKGKELEDIHMAAHLHDIGKIGIPDNILNKSGKLLTDEWECIKTHPKIGFDILNKSNKLKNISDIVLCHHERWDGKGYIQGLSGKNIPLGSRIIAVCDSVDAMTSNRSYRKAMNFNECVNQIRFNKGVMFDPVIADCFLDNAVRFEKVIASFKKNINV
ncbi:HD-GYP domain-containing protein [Clostridium oryzae]|uniref:HD-GYP domain-containing protein n=1 Tax=Clostridium oryzae TaxID=1450648 RepID=UPI001FA91E9B|nr:HD-GYP domain-containing protein [Clostridium oryzae]